MGDEDRSWWLTCFVGDGGQVVNLFRRGWRTGRGGLPVWWGWRTGRGGLPVWWGMRTGRGG